MLIDEREERAVNVEQLAYSGQPCLGICVGKHCARAGAKRIIRAAEAALDEAGLAESVTIRLTKCQDHCDDSPAMAVAPGQFPYVQLAPEDAREVVLSHLRAGQPVLRLLERRFRRKLERRMAKREATIE